MAANEAGIHRSIIAWLRQVMPDAIVHHSANEGVRGGKAGMLDGARRKSMGQVAGFPDITVLTGAYVGALFFEVKALTGKVSPDQQIILGRLDTFGHKVAVVHSIDDVRAKLCEWGVPTKEKTSLVRLPVRGVVS